MIWMQTLNVMMETVQDMETAAMENVYVTVSTQENSVKSKVHIYMQLSAKTSVP